MRHRTRVSVSSLLLLPLLGLLSAATASPAAAQAPPTAPVTDLLCPIAATVRIAPGITLLAQPQQLTGHVQGGTAVSPLTPCTSLTGVPYQGFTMELTGTGGMACSIAALEGGLSGTAQVTWDNGDTSTVDWSVTTVAMVPVVNVTVTDGALAGASVIVGGVPTSLTGNCVLNPVTGVGFGGVAEFLRTGG
ncbi:MAG: hypothetical protein ACRD2X_20905 [Vicinamibacteraceae bacterium]